MVLTRRVDSEATLAAPGRAGLWASCLGQEAAQVGWDARSASSTSASPLSRARRGLVLGCRPTCTCWACSAGLILAAGTLRRAVSTSTRSSGRRRLHATGYAMAVERDGLVGTGDPDRDMAVVGYFGDGATSQGDVNEAFIFASSYNAPIVFFCQNNQWAISEPIERQSRTLVSQGFWFRFPRHASTATMCSAVYGHYGRPRAGHTGSGPSLIEAYTYRMGARPPPTIRRSIDSLTSSSTGG